MLTSLLLSMDATAALLMLTCASCVAQAPMARGQVLAIAKLTNMGQGKHGDKAKQVRMTTHCASSLAPQCSCAPSAVVLLWWPLGCRR